MDENKDEVSVYNDVNFCDEKNSKVSNNRVYLDSNKIGTDGSNAIKNDIQDKKYYSSSSVDVYSELNDAFFNGEFIDKEVSDNNKYTSEEYLTNEYESEKLDYNSERETLDSKSLKNRSSKYNKVVDLEYIRAAKKGDLYAMNYIFNKYKPIIFQKSSVYFLKGSDKEDIIQEGLIGLYYAVKTFDENVGASFGSFAKLCVSRQMINAVRTSTSKKNRPLNDYLSISSPGNNEEKSLFEIENVYPQDNPEKMVLSMESIEQITELINSELTTFEETVLNLFLLGDSYQEIAKKLGKNPKSIDNAVQRTRKKLEKVLK